MIEFARTVNLLASMGASMRWLVVLCFGVVVPQVTLAQAPDFGPSEAQKRRTMLPYVRAATDCITSAVGRDATAATAYRNGTLDHLIASVSMYCSPQLQNMVSAHDQLYGYGTGAQFRDGAYRLDLPRAVLSRIKPELERRAVAEETQRREREAAQAAEAERRRVREAEEAEQRRIAEAAEAERRRVRDAEEQEKRRIREAEELERRRQQAAEEEARRRVAREGLERTRDLLRERLYSCADRETDSMIAANETAEITSQAALTICSRELQALIDGQLAIVRFDGASPTVLDIDNIRKLVKESVVASVIKKKAASAQRSDTRRVATTPANSEQEAVKSCLKTVFTTATKDRLVEREKTFATMIDLCRSEIEALGRARLLNGSEKTLDVERAAAVSFARDEANRLFE